MNWFPHLKSPQPSSAVSSLSDQLIGICIRVNPCIYHVLRQDQRHPVMDETDLLSRFPCKDNEERHIILKAVKATQPGHAASLWLDCVFVPGLRLPVTPDQMLPLKVIRSWDNTPMAIPGILKGRLYRGRFDAGIHQKRLPGKSPFHRKDSPLPVHIRGNHRYYVGRAHLPIGLYRKELVPFPNKGGTHHVTHDFLHFSCFLDIVPAAHLRPLLPLVICNPSSYDIIKDFEGQKKRRPKPPPM